MYITRRIRFHVAIAAVLSLSSCSRQLVILHADEASTFSEAASQLQSIISEAEAQGCHITQLQLGAGHGMGLGVGLGLGHGVGVGVSLGEPCPDCDGNDLTNVVKETKTDTVEKSQSESKVYFAALARCPKSANVNRLGQVDD